MYISKDQTNSLLMTGTVIYSPSGEFSVATADEVMAGEDVFSITDAALVHEVYKKDPRRVLTAIDLDTPTPEGDSVALVPGFRYVNRWGFIILANPLPEQYTENDVFLYGGES